VSSKPTGRAESGHLSFKKKSGHLQKIPQLAAMETQYRRMSFGGLKLMG
jgi:hypothetical protein